MTIDKRPTLSDIAEKAGVSNSTVSRVINNNCSVNKSVREKVLSAIKELGYEKRIKKHKKETKQIIGVLIPNIDNAYFPLLVKAIESTAKIYNYSIILVDSEDNVEAENKNIDRLLEIGVDGLICIPSQGNNHKIKQIKNIPVVFLDRVIDYENICSVTIDNEEGAYQAVKYLINLGNKNIIYISGPKDISTEKHRFGGYKKALSESGIEIDSNLIINGDYKYESAYQEMKKIIKNNIFFSSVFASNDMMAFGAMKALEENNIKIPDEVSLIGYDDILFSSITLLTTVSQPKYEMGRNATIMLIDLINQRIKPPYNIILKPSMVIRSTCKKIY